MDFNPKNYFLERQGGGTASKIILLNKAITSIGRAESNDNVLYSTYVSRNHAVIRFKGNKIFLKDLGSANGTYVNDLKLSNAEQEVKMGDMIGWGCSKSAFGMNPDLIFFHKIRVPDCIDLDSDSDSDATDINELCDDLANNPGVDSFFSNTRNSAIDEIICVSSDEEVEVDQEWMERVIRRSSSPVPVSISGQPISSNSIQAPNEQLPMVVLPESARKRSNLNLDELNPSKSPTVAELSKPEIQTEEVVGNLLKCSVLVTKLTQEEISSFQSLEGNKNDNITPKTTKKDKKGRSHNLQNAIRKLCDSDDSDSSDGNNKHIRGKGRKNKTELECDMNVKSPMKITIRRKSVDTSTKTHEKNSIMYDPDYKSSAPTPKKRKIMTRRHSVYESKSDLSKEKSPIPVPNKVPTRVVPKRRASMLNEFCSSGPEKKLKPCIPDRAIQIQALPNKQMRQRSKYNEKETMPLTSTNTKPITPNNTKKITSNVDWKKDRNEKIRKIAENQLNKIEEPPTVNRVKTPNKPVAKMTMHNRGSFLTEIVDEKINKHTSDKIKSISKTTIVSNVSQNSNTNDIKITIEQFRNSHLNADSLSNEAQGVCNNLQFYQNISASVNNSSNSNSSSINKKIQQRKLTITLDEEELKHQKLLQQSIPTGFYNEIPIKTPTYSPTVELTPFIQSCSSQIPSTSKELLQDTFETPTIEVVEIKSILSPIGSKKIDKKRVSFNQNLVQVREIPMINSRDPPNDNKEEEDSYKQYLDVEIEETNPIEKILNEILSWCPRWLDTKKGEATSSKQWHFKSMLQSYESLDQYKKIIDPIIKMDLLSNIRSKYDNLTKEMKHKWSTLKPTYFSKTVGSLFSFQATADVTDNRKNYSAGTLIILKLTVNNKENKIFGYICESIDRINQFKIQCSTDEINYCSVTTANKVEILPIMYVRSDLKSLLSLNQLTETDIMMKILKPETNEPPVTVTPTRYGILNLNPSQSEISCRIVEDLINNKDAKVIALQGGPGTGKTKVIVACVMKIISKSKKNCKILICSKSNTCIDEITVHLDSLSKFENSFNLVRFGNHDRMSKSVLHISLNTLANQYLNSTTENSNFQKAKMSVIQMADVVCSTMNSSYDLITDYKKHFDVCFIDEASQFTDADLIIPVQSGFRKLVLVGDSKQLQPNINAIELKNLNFEISLLDRMNKIRDKNSRKNPVLTLTIQHRMNQDIFKFPNQYFYDNQISTNVLNCSNIALKPYMVFGLKCDQNMTQDTSSYNTDEIKFCYHLCESLLTILPPNLTISIITPYLRQREEVLKYFKEGERTNEQKSRVEVHTIDSAQGLEKDIVIMSVVKTRGVGFLANPQRLNVALTRAKKALYICGNFSSLKNNSMWRALLDDSKHRKCYRDIESNAPNCQIISSIKRSS